MVITIRGGIVADMCEKLSTEEMNHTLHKHLSQQITQKMFELINSGYLKVQTKFANDVDKSEGIEACISFNILNDAETEELQKKLNK